MDIGLLTSPLKNEMFEQSISWKILFALASSRTSAMIFADGAFFRDRPNKRTANESCCSRNE